MTNQEQKAHQLKIQLEVYAHKEAELKQKQQALREYAQEIARAHCPYKLGDRVIYTEWHDPRKEHTGVVFENPRLRISKEAIDGLWMIVVQPTRKNGKWHQGKSPVTLGYHGGAASTYDSIRHAEVRP